MKTNFEPPFRHRAFDLLLIVAGLGWLLLVCAMGGCAALLGWRALDQWCEGQLKDNEE